MVTTDFQLIESAQTPFGVGSVISNPVIHGKVFLKLRSNVVLEGDVDLAEREVQIFFSNVVRVTQESHSDDNLPRELAVLHTRRGLHIGFIATGAKVSIAECARKLNFIQEIWLLSDADVAQVELSSWVRVVQTQSKKIACILPLMACGEILSQIKKRPAVNEDVSNLCALLSGNLHAGISLKAPSTGGTSTQHVHALHKYKAKFFPRLIRSFLIKYLDQLPRSVDNKIILLDPFVGSGTALIEASLMGIESVGVDIDPLSCEISTAKLAALTASPVMVEEAWNQIEEALNRLNSIPKRYVFPTAISKKFERWNSVEEKNLYELEISKWLCAIETVSDEQLRKLFLICLSDALTRKFVIRMMGTGVGRFALELAKTSLDKLMKSNMEAATLSVRCAKTLIDNYALNLAQSTVIQGTAIDIPYPDSSFSVVLTSPPYLPASSGREDYLVGKAISNVALGLMTDSEISKAEESSVGSMKWIESDISNLPVAVIELYDWLTADSLREIKAKPTLAYYISLRKALVENFRVLLPGGVAIYVIGKESVFYKFSTREVLYRVDCDKIFREIAISCGFNIIEQADIELDKKNKNARPRSLDSYYESVFVLKKPINDKVSCS